jgi:hypothetical protein
LSKGFKRLSWFAGNGFLAYATYAWLMKDAGWGQVVFWIMLGLALFGYIGGLLSVTVRKDVIPFNSYLPIWLSDLFDLGMTAFLVVMGSVGPIIAYVLQWLLFYALQKKLVEEHPAA